MIAKEALIGRKEPQEEQRATSGLIGASTPLSYAVYSCNCSDSAVGFFYATFAHFPYEPVVSFYEDDDRSLLTMFASQAVLSRDWDSPEEDAAWAHL